MYIFVCILLSIACMYMFYILILPPEWLKTPLHKLYDEEFKLRFIKDPTSTELAQLYMLQMKIMNIHALNVAYGSNPESWVKTANLWMEDACRTRELYNKKVSE